MNYNAPVCKRREGERVITRRSLNEFQNSEAFMACTHLLKAVFSGHFEHRSVKGNFKVTGI